MSPAGVSLLISSGKDFDLLARLKRRDPAAMADLFDSYGRLLYSLLLRMVGTTELAEQLLEESFLEVWNRSVVIPPGHSSLGLWIFALTRNRAIDYLKNSKGRPAAVASVSPKSLHNPRLYADLQVESNLLERLRGMQATFRGLDGGERRILEMAFFEGASSDEIAAAVQQPLPVVEDAVKRSLAAVSQA